MLFADFTISTEVLLGIIGAQGGMLIGTIAYLFRLLIAAKDAALVLRENELELKAKDEKNTSTMAMVQQATTNLEIAAAKYAASIGKAIPEALVPVVPKHNSPTTKEQREDAELATLQARITAATLALDLPARQPAVMETKEDAAVRQGKAPPTKDDLIMDKLDRIERTQADDRAKTLIDQIAPAPTPVVVANEDPVLVKIDESQKKDIAKAVIEAIDTKSKVGEP